ncbi:outer membrane lipoprotein-sorting protein [Spirochaeta cellobiosiphila]|uniref:outer membrane lipoprotein-sorting protein n=1 Tax=Spirochaeta cellobiosiphila TaxID=504483 RepID=UPI0004027BFB|nr:outer membrane lipoprotein-sorting protein [Spirochaeta cellobiosiphila]
MRSTFIFIFLTMSLTIYSQSAQVIVQKADDNIKGPQVWSLSTIQIVRNGNTLPLQRMEGYSMDINGQYHSLTVYLGPPRMKGTAYLMIEDNLWVRFSSTGRVRKLSSSAKKNSAGGSDFSYNDMGDDNAGISSKYRVRLAGEKKINKQNCYLIEMFPKNEKSSSYDKILAYISEKDFHYIQLDYYEAGALIKTMTLNDYRSIDQKEYPYIITMESHVKNSITTITTESIEFNSPKVKSQMFSPSYIQNESIF